MSLGFGDVARIGHLYPSGGLCDYEIQLMAPSGIQFVTTRLPFRNTGVTDDLRLVEGLERHAQLLADAEVSVIAVNCTAATLLAGPEQIKKRITEATGLPAITTIEAVLAALAATGSRHPALLTPYPSYVVEAEESFLRSHGIDVAAHVSIPCATPVEQATVAPERWLDLASSLGTSAIDGVLLSCAGVRVAPVLQQIEYRLELPVVASNQALLWYLLHTLDIQRRTDKYGALLSGRFKMT